MVPAILALIAAAYLLGSIPTGYLLVRIFLKKDIRGVGSGNIGATNVLRSGAKGLGAATFLLDVLKGILAVKLGVLLAAALAHAVPATPIPGFSARDAQALAALAAVLGHIFPVWLGFKGGKGVATAFGVFTVLATPAAFGVLALFIVVFAIWRYVSLASIAAAATFPVLVFLTIPAYPSKGSSAGPISPFFLAVCVGICLIVILKHHQNIRRLAVGAEYRFGGKSKSVGTLSTTMQPTDSTPQTAPRDPA